uniref:Transcription factor protein n=2 Tax=Ciona intestinalis TaxID=7719 RepID=F7ABQ1_CIOIN|nr:transcription factor protein isoform X2 [Ciona intestinalis]|eukprot:XP_018672756.1 transcription factor protein isoform X2 [Ciona intestinalis]
MHTDHANIGGASNPPTLLGGLGVSDETSYPILSNPFNDIEHGQGMNAGFTFGQNPDYFDYNDTSDNGSPSPCDGQRTPSTCNSWAASPYSALDTSLAISPQQSPCHPSMVEKLTHKLSLPERQTSLSIAIEVLGTCENPSLPFQNYDYPPTPTSNVSDDHFTPGDSPISAPPRLRTFSGFEARDWLKCDDVNNRTRSYSSNSASGGVVDLTNLMEPIVLPETYIHLNNNTTPHHTLPPHANQPSQPINPQSTCIETPTRPPTLQSLPSIVEDAIAQAKPFEMLEESSLDVHGMLDDIMDVGNTQQQNPSHDVVVIQEDHCYSSQTLTIVENPVEEVLAVKPDPVVDLTDAPSTSGVKVSRKRDRNNAACRESRKKKKMKLVEAEMEVVRLVEDNEVQRLKIARLEVEVKETKALLLSKMTGKTVKP